MKKDKDKDKDKDNGNPSYIWVVVRWWAGRGAGVAIRVVADAVDAVYAPNRPRQSPVWAVWCCGWRGIGIGIGSGIGKGNGMGIGTTI